MNGRAAGFGVSEGRAARSPWRENVLGDKVTRSTEEANKDVLGRKVSVAVNEPMQSMSMVVSSEPRRTARLWRQDSHDGSDDQGRDSETVADLCEKRTSTAESRRGDVVAAEVCRMPGSQRQLGAEQDREKSTVNDGSYDRVDGGHVALTKGNSLGEVAGLAHSVEEKKSAKTVLAEGGEAS